MSSQLTYYLYAEIPGTYPAWTVAVLAINRKDANEHMKAVWRGGKFKGSQTSGKVEADCGAVTEAAQEILHKQMQES